MLPCRRQIAVRYAFSLRLVLTMRVSLCSSQRSWRHLARSDETSLRTWFCPAVRDRNRVIYREKMPGFLSFQDRRSTVTVGVTLLVLFC